jgi:hypothetical protein
MAVKPRVKIPVGETPEELEQRGRIFGLRRTKAHGGPVAENDVGNSLDRRSKRWGGPHETKCRRSSLAGHPNATAGRLRVARNLVLAVRPLANPDSTAFSPRVPR